MTAQIEPLSRGAALALAAMHPAAFPEDPWDVVTLERILALSGVFGYVAWYGEDPLGFVVARDLGGECEILTLGVLPRRRRHGFGRALLDATIADARRRGSASLVLEVAADNQPARQLYAAAGFIRVGRRPRYYRHRDRTIDGLILRCSITGKNAAAEN